MGLQTPLFHFHAANAKKMGEFAGFEMPFYYDAGVIAEHEAVRKAAGLFDVSHMGQIEIKGSGAADFIEKITPSAFQKTPYNMAKYTVLLNETGGIIDDLIITRLSDDHFFAVINAGCKEKDIAWIEANLSDGLSLIRHDDRALIALQGPKAEAVLSKAVGADLSELGYMRMVKLTDKDIWVSRLGYTGEDGFEISLKADEALEFWQGLVDKHGVMPCGLAARDSLRLEMGYPLYGHDITTETTPIEAGLSWVVRKKDNDYIGGDVIAEQKQGGVTKKRVGLVLQDKGIAREGVIILNQAGDKIGEVTSGSHAPSLGKAIAMGYVEAEYATIDIDLFLEIRGRKLAAKVNQMPFVKAKTKSVSKVKNNAGKAA